MHHQQSTRPFFFPCIRHSSSCLHGKQTLRVLVSCPRSSQANRALASSIPSRTAKAKKSKALGHHREPIAQVQSPLLPIVSAGKSKTPPLPLGHHRQTTRHLNAGCLPFARSTARAWNSGKSKPFFPLLAVALYESGATRPVSHRHLQGGALPWFYLPLSSRCSLPYHHRRLFCITRQSTGRAEEAGTPVTSALGLIPLCFERGNLWRVVPCGGGLDSLAHLAPEVIEA